MARKKAAGKPEATPDNGRAPLRLEYRTAAELADNPENWRTHPPGQQAALKEVLDQVGWAGALLYNERTKRLIDGHARKHLGGDQPMPVLIGDWTAAEERKILATLDPIAALAAPNKDALSTLLGELGKQSDGIQAMLDDLAAKAGLNDEEQGAGEAADPQADRAIELQKQWGTKRGQVWEIAGRNGTHRVMCGDSTASGDVQRLLNGAKPFIMVTDPPYGVQYDAKWRTAAGLQKTGAHGKVTSDDRAGWSSAYAHSPAQVAYVWHAGLYAATVMKGLEAAGFEVFSQIIWAKTRFAIGRGHYHWAHEPCWAAVRKGSTAEFQGGRKQSTVWGQIIDTYKPKGPPFYAAQVDAETIYAFGAELTTVWELKQDKMCDGGHSTQKPVECMARPIRNHGEKGCLVYDPFGGTGTTLLAAEQEQRVSVLMEISPQYLAVILQRTADSQMTPKLVYEP